ncbi:hypothetical protein CSB09_04620 [Candidatus Gracilibacteria bacterium]|nr:MAG: hypothetical protein CSB09_04620 [Candidatus Gracilibacteria bacterium]
MNIYLHNPKDFSNICTISRTLEFFGIHKCYIYDTNNLIREKYGKSYSRKLRTQSAGAFEKIRFEKIEDYQKFLENYSGRKVATVLDKNSGDLQDFSHKEDDIILFGNETFGLPKEVIESADEKIFIQGNGLTQSLNLSNSLAIIVYSIISKNSHLKK